MQIDLTNATFIMPLRIESQDRLRNIVMSLAYLLNNFKTNVIIQEVDSESKFQNYAADELEKLVNDLSPITLIYEENADPIFHRTRILNDMLMDATTDVVINYDTDVIFPIESYVSAYNMILKDEYDLVYPYAQGTYQHKVNMDQDLINKFINSSFSEKTLRSNPSNEVSTSDYGWAQFFKRQSYIDGGMENENFKAYSPEDKERFYRFNKLGYNVGRVNGYVYHLEHFRGENSWFNNPHMNSNIEEWEKIQMMNEDKLLEYYSNQSYLKKYKKK